MTFDREIKEMKEQISSLGMRVAALEPKEESAEVLETPKKKKAQKE